jgi:predicted transcriptional regulator
MQELTLELAPEIYRRLREEAEHLGETPQAVARQWLTERLAAHAPTPESDREKAHQALADAGLLTELGPNLRRLANPSVRLESIVAALSRTDGKPLSEIVLEQRGAKE